MRLVRSIEPFLEEPFLRRLKRGATVGVTIGNFDGMHLGHQRLFATLRQSLAGVVEPIQILMTFAPHPRRVLGGVKRHEVRERPEFWQISTLREKMLVAEEFGFDYFYALRFTSGFSRLSPEQFVSNYLASILNAKVVVIGEDWAFGSGRRGRAEELKVLGRTYGFNVHVVPSVEIGGLRVSSSAIKDALRRGEIASARQLLGRNPSLCGVVRHGEKRGRTLGFPTANLRLTGQVLPADGIYATRATIDGVVYNSVSNVGMRPTFEGQERLVEVHLLADGWHELYGKRLELQFVERIREERRFEKIEELVDTMHADAAKAREILADSGFGE